MSSKFDVVIVGAGIGGLVSGCYLAKKGFKVLISEQNSQPGGCCVSFKRGGFLFDAGVHSLGSLRDGGVISEILKDLNVQDRLKFVSAETIDRIVIPGKEIFIMRNINKTKNELIKAFPKEKESINRFFKFIIGENFLSIVAKTKKITFKELLDSFFQDLQLKVCLSVLISNLGLPPSRASALISIVLFREFVFDGGYYPRGGIQQLPDLLAHRFQEYGGKLLLNSKVVRIVTERRKVMGIQLYTGESIAAQCVISNADASSTFMELLDCLSAEIGVLKRLKPSISAFVLYLGLKMKIKITPEHLNTWYFLTCDLDKCYSFQKDYSNLISSDFLLCTFPTLMDSSLAPPNKSIVRVFTRANFANKEIWDSNKDVLCHRVKESLERILPGIDDCIEVQESATPHTFHRFTSNRRGALFGWESTPSQVDRNTFPFETKIINLFLTGHWVTNGFGQASVSLVSWCGRNTASFIQKSYKRIML